MYRYRFHGVDVSSEIDLKSTTANEDSPFQLSLSIVLRQASFEPIGTAIWQSPETFSGGIPQAVLYMLDERPLLKLPGTGCFHIGETRIEAFLEDESYPAPFVLGKVLGLWLELTGQPVLHGSSIEVGEAAVGLLGHSGVGKSTLAAAFQSKGYQLVTDDLIPVPSIKSWRIYPGIPISRMWPDSGRRFVKDYQQCERVHPNYEKRLIPGEFQGNPRFTRAPRIMRRIYVLDRSSAVTDIKVTDLNPAAAVIELVRQSYWPGPAEALGLQPRRMRTFADIVQEVPVLKLCYPSDFEMLDRVCKLILEAMETPHR